MGDYYDHYLKKDLLLLAEVFKNFIDTCLNFHKLDPSHYFISPGLSWDSMLKMTGAEFFWSDIGKHLFLEKGLRGGIWNIVKRQSKASNKYMKNYDPTKPSIYIQYLDINNLYGCGMSDYLPYGGFKWLRNTDKFDENSISEKRPIGYILEVDLKYSDELHVLHNDYPLAPEKLAIPYDMLSSYRKKNCR